MKRHASFFKNDASKMKNDSYKIKKHASKIGFGACPAVIEACKIGGWTSKSRGYGISNSADEVWGRVGCGWRFVIEGSDCHNVAKSFSPAVGAGATTPGGGSKN